MLYLYVSGIITQQTPLRPHFDNLLYVSVRFVTSTCLRGKLKCLHKQNSLYKTFIVKPAFSNFSKYQNGSLWHKIL